MSAKRVLRIDSLPADAPWAGGAAPEGVDHGFQGRMLSRLLNVQRPVVLAHLRSVRLRHPEATPAELVRILERRYLAAVTGGGAAVGATAVIPGIGTGVTLALSGVETAGFLEATALFAQSVAEVHAIPVADPVRAQALVMTLMLGAEGTSLLSQFGAQAAGTGVARPAFWGELITRSLPKAALGPLVENLKRRFVAQFTARGGASLLGKALPFGVGAAIGAGGNHLLGRKVIRSARTAFGPPPPSLPATLSPKPGAQRVEHTIVAAAAHAAKAVGRGAADASRTVTRTGRHAVGSLGRRADDQPDAPPLGAADASTPSRPPG